MFEPAFEVMSTMDPILQKEIVYRAQMGDIREAVLRFMEPRGWCLMSRGRRAHVSVYGPVGALALDGVIDIMMEEVDWDKMPEALQEDTSFYLWCSAGLDRDGLRLSADTELFWRAPFALLARTVDMFLPRAWEMLTGLTEANLLQVWPGPSGDPDGPLSFGPPRRRGVRKPEAR